MGDKPMEPPSVVLDPTRDRPALDIDTDPIDRSDQQSTPTLSLMSPRRCEGQSAERAAGDKGLVKGTYPHITPVVSRRPLTRPPWRPRRGTLRRSGQPEFGSSSCPRERPTSPAPSSVATARRLLRGTTFGTSFSRGRAAGDRRVRRQSPPPGRSKSPTPIPRLQYPRPRPAPAPMSPTFSPVIYRGTQTTRSATHPVHLWLSERWTCLGFSSWATR
jgi:hypothetical protein